MFWICETYLSDDISLQAEFEANVKENLKIEVQTDFEVVENSEIHNFFTGSENFRFKAFSSAENHQRDIFQIFKHCLNSALSISMTRRSKKIEKIEKI